jgi:hypothetical protein
MLEAAIFIAAIIMLTVAYWMSESHEKFKKDREDDL